MGKYLDLEGLEYLYGKIKTDLNSKQNQLSGQPGQLIGFCSDGISAVDITAGDSVRLTQSNNGLEVGVDMDNGIVSGDPALLDDLTKQGTYSWLDTTGSMGTAGGLWNVVVSRSNYGTPQPSVTQTLFGTYGAKTRGKVLNRAFYYANTPNWTPWRDMISSDQITNPNLLDNWYFPNPINQRGQTEYDASDLIYTIDRWKLYSGKCTLGTKGVELAYQNDHAAFSQFIDTNLTGQLVSLSVIVNGILYSESGIVTDNANLTVIASCLEGVFIRVYTRNGITAVDIIAKNPSAPSSFTVSAIKLELGPVQTLAHQDADGGWVLNDPPPDPALELSKCQRYQLFGPLYGIRLWTYTTNSTGFLVPVPSTFRAKPSLVGEIQIQKDGSTEFVSYSGQKTLDIRQNCLYVYLTPLGENGQDYNTLYIPAGSGFDANL